METQNQNYSFQIQCITNNVNPGGATINVTVEGYDGTAAPKAYTIAARSSADISSSVNSVNEDGGIVTITLGLPEGSPTVRLKKESGTVYESSNEGPWQPLLFMPMPIPAGPLNTDATSPIVAMIPFKGTGAMGGILVIGTVEDFPEV